MKTDEILFLIADYVANKEISNPLAFDTAKLCLMDSIGCALLSLKFEECKKLLGPIVEGTVVPHGSRVLGTNYILDPIQAAFNFGTMIRFLDYNDTWLGLEWAHPSDNLGAILPICDYMSQKGHVLTLKDLLTAMIKAYEIQGIIALSNSFNSIGFDHVILVKVATAAVTTKILGGNFDQILNAVSNSWIDTGPLRTYRHFPNTGSRKSWAAGDQCSRGAYFAWLSMRGEMGYKSALTAKKWGLYDTLFKGEPFSLKKPFDSFVLENILFKVSFPAEFHAQTAVECGIILHQKIKDRFHEIRSIEIQTQEPALRIIDKSGPLNNYADRDHCLQYMTAVALLTGDLKEEDYHDSIAKNPMIDLLRDKMKVVENKRFTEEYYDITKRSIANGVTIYLKDGSSIGPIIVEYPLGHPRRREEAIPLLMEKFKNNLSSHYKKDKVEELLKLFETKGFDEMLVCDFVNHF